MAPLSRGGIPVAGGGGRNGARTGAGGGNAGAAVATAANPRGRRPSREAGQAPWRSSLDLVWSYSRSQAFYGENIATSPSFADRRWAGPSHGVDSSVDETSEEEEEDDEDDELYEDELETEDDERRYDDDDIVAQSPAGALEWADEQLPPNAIPRQASRNNVLGRRMTRNAGERSPGRRGDSTRVMDRNIRRITDDTNTDDERSRSRSRSPKRVGVSRLASSSLRNSSSSSRLVDSLRSNLASAGKLITTKAEDEQGEARRGRKRDPLPRDADEDTPLLAKGNDGQLESQVSDRPALRTPSWFRNSNLSISSAKYRMQGYGTSTFWQSWFNTVNALVGVGILALPLAISYAGLIPGILMFLLCGLATNYTGKILAHIMAAEPSMRTYADIGNLAFGPRARFFVTALFCLELWAVSTALVILFGDSLQAFIVSLSKGKHPFDFIVVLAGWSPAAFKALGLLIVLPTMFLSLRLLSPISVIGIISVVTLFIVVLCDGLIKEHAPGSIRDPIAPHLGPQWSKLPLSFGLIMSGFSSHPIIPSLFKDMRNPKTFCRMLNWAYVAATIIYLAMGLIGYLMFGSTVSDEITRDISHTPGYPRILNLVALWLIIINPLSKFALAARPIVTTVEILLGVEKSQTGERMSPTVPRSPAEQRKQYPALDDGANGNTYGATGEGAAQPSSSNRVAQASRQANHQSRQHDHQHEEEEREEEIPVRANESNPLADSMISIRAAERTASWSRGKKIAIRVSVQVAVTVLIGVTAIILPGFEKVMAFLGAFLACATCIFGPIVARLILFRHELTRARVALDVTMLFVFFIVAALGTIWSFLPVSLV